jgi:hypothetical protein
LLGTVAARTRLPSRLLRMSPTWISLQVAIVVFVIIGMIIAIIRLA